MEPLCECGAPVSHANAAGHGICIDCYKGLSVDERRRFVERKLRGVERVERRY